MDRYRVDRHASCPLWPLVQWAKPALEGEVVEDDMPDGGVWMGCRVAAEF